MKSLLNFPYNFFIIPAIIIYTAVKGGRFVKQGMGKWYDEIKKPDWVPPKKMFGEIWFFLYVLTGVAVMWYWDVSYPGWFKIPTGIVLLANAYYNAQWNKDFFVDRDIVKSLRTLKYLNITGLAATLLIAYHSPIAAFMFLPYVIWVGVATHMTQEIHKLNGSIQAK